VVYPVPGDTVGADTQRVARRCPHGH